MKDVGTKMTGFADTSVTPLVDKFQQIKKNTVNINKYAIFFQENFFPCLFT